MLFIILPATFLVISINICSHLQRCSWACVDVPKFHLVWGNTHICDVNLNAGRRTLKKIAWFHNAPYARNISQTKLAPSDLGTEQSYLYIRNMPTAIIFLRRQLSEHRSDRANSDLEITDKVVANGVCVRAKTDIYKSPCKVIVMCTRTTMISASACHLLKRKMSKSGEK